MKRLFFSIVAFFFFVTLISCKNKYDFRKSRDAADQIVEEIKNKRVVFLGDNHSNVLPVLFLTENLEKFYEAGVRFIFLEEQSDGYIENPERINFFVYPPWCKFGYKFEYIKFEEEIKRINKIHENDPLIPIWPETGLVIEKDAMEDDNYVMNHCCLINFFMS